MNPEIIPKLHEKRQFKLAILNRKYDINKSMILAKQEIIKYFPILSFINFIINISSPFGQINIKLHLQIN